MSRIKGGYIILSSVEFKSFLFGEMRNDKYLRSFYNDIESSNKTILANNIKVFEPLEFDLEDTLNYEIHLNECVFEKEIKFHNGEFNILSFTSCRFNERINISNGRFSKWLWFNNCEFDKNIVILNGYFNNLHFHSCLLMKSLLIEGGIFEDLYLGQTRETSNISVEGPYTLVNRLKIKGNDKARISVSNCIVNSLMLTGIFNSSSVLLVEDIRLNSLFYEKAVNLGKMFLLNIEVLLCEMTYTKEPIDSIFSNDLKFKEFDKESIERLINKKKIDYLIEYMNDLSSMKTSFIKRNENKLIAFLFQPAAHYKINSSSFKLFESSLGILEIKNLDIEKFSKITVDSSDLSSVKTLNSKFPTKKGEIKSLTNTSKNLYHLYNDLYSSSAKQNNVKDKIEYYKASQENLLLSTKRENRSLKNMSSLFSLMTARYYSDYGQNWIKAFLLIVIIIGPFFYWLLILSTNNIEIDLSSKGINYFIDELLQHFPQFLNPTHKLSYFDDIFNFGKWSTAIDLVSRIFIGIGIFEMIRSFRKYVRK
jgi:hypothetical protein